MAARVRPRRGESAPNSRRGARQRVDRHVPDSQCVGCDFPSQGGVPQRNSIRSRPVRSQNCETDGGVPVLRLCQSTLDVLAREATWRDEEWHHDPPRCFGSLADRSSARLFTAKATPRDLTPVKFSFAPSLTRMFPAGTPSTPASAIRPSARCRTSAFDHHLCRLCRQWWFMLARRSGFQSGTPYLIPRCETP
jgi:hypothetical protein